MQTALVHTFEYLPLVEGDNNTTDQYVLINDDGTIISEDLVLQDGAGSEVFSDNFLLNTDQNTSIQASPRSIQVIDHINNDDKEVDNMENCTQVTLSDEQSRLLELKGRVLLELEDKVYLLDTLGIHDISADLELIQKMRAEMCSNEKYDDGTRILQESSSYEVTPVNSPANIESEKTLPQIRVPYVKDELTGDKLSDIEVPKDSKKERAQNEVVIVEYYVTIEPDLPTLVESVTGVSCPKPNTEETKKIDSSAVEKINQPLTTSQTRTKMQTKSPKKIKRLPVKRKGVKKQKSKLIVPDKKISLPIGANQHHTAFKVDFNVEDIPQKIFIGFSENGKKLFSRIINVKRNYELGGTEESCCVSPVPAKPLLSMESRKGNTRKYSCHICKKSFDRPFNFHRHVAIHAITEEKKVTSTTASSPQSVNKKSVFVCDICFSSYKFSSSLLRHILTQHADINAD